VPGITAPLVNFATDVVGSYGAWAVFILMILESACIPVPSEAIMVFGGFLAGQGKVALWAVVAAGVGGNLVGSWIAHWVGATKDREWALRWHWLHITPAPLDAAGRWFGKYDDGPVLMSRCLPIIRTFISLPAGVARMPFWRFSVLTLIGCIPWCLLFAYAGLAVGDNWETLQKQLHGFDSAVAAAILLALAWVVVRYRRKGAAA